MADTSTAAPSFGPQPPSGRLAGRRILVTGAASGIGWKIAELFAAEGAALALLDRQEEALRRCARAAGGIPLPCDVSDETSVNAAVAQVARELGGLDGVVNSAGVSRPGLIADVSMEAWREVIGINLIGPHMVVKAALPWLREAPWATIVNIASGQGLQPAGPANHAYAASKGGLINLTRSLAKELAPRIRVNSVCPGMVETPLTEGRSGDGSQYALKRNGSALEVAQAALFMSSPESAFVTGTALAVDGGRTFH
ncbi:SDR family oxidoreductase [Roseococcus sp. SYP-B2431]|uniref:SDR family NAD(P)-dependent oxidoreductase n=1 Tax=Roseococcus sp. SYP-B2431 TaxID=2496640 RepID=UPI00103C7186|nr:SDR family oxidoreductase [Roseococcus sp. SYP-B2431]TCH99423.1 SDR family oxidoreductase [Roseococcus sp. SYP-B2431]